MCGMPIAGRHRCNRPVATTDAEARRPGREAALAARGERPFLVGAFVLGVGLGGFLDGIVFHQILQWHHLLSERYPTDTLANLELNTLADGLFHLSMWFVTVLGVAILLAAARRSRPPAVRVVVGASLLGWGAFQLVEAVVDHQLLGLHHVHPGTDELAWDVADLVFGVVLLAAGLFLVRQRRHSGASPADGLRR
jgi:uncharacterized membrane protein